MSKTLSKNKMLKISTPLAGSLALALTLSACGAGEDPLSNRDGDSSTVTVGAANFPESEILGQLYAQILQEHGVEVNFQGGIGARDVYLAALEAGDIDIVPEYSGNAAQFYAAGQPEEEKLAPGATAEDVENVLVGVLPDGVEAGEAAPAESKDSYRVSATFAEEHDLRTLEDLARLAETQTINLAGNPELEARPYGPKGLEQVYGVPADKIQFTAISDGGGPLTVGALKDGSVDVADIYTTSPVLDRSGNELDVVELEDTKRLILSQHVIPLLRTESFDGVSQEAKDALVEMQKALTTEDLKAMNQRNSGAEKAEPAVIAKDWLRDRGLAH